MYLASLGDGDADVDDAILGHMFDNEAGIRGNPPAAKRVVEDLPVVKLTLEEGDMVCAVCKDEMVLEEEVKRLPCRHLYHGECITPWLGIRNTCPVCRFELPTDDLEYERHRRSQRSDTSLFLAG
ncbi:RING/U-box superfamily protein [Raphanus sativus]|nr:RING/U-box superfamily protein [Raphanus sativus]